MYDKSLTVTAVLAADKGSIRVAAETQASIGGHKLTLDTHVGDETMTIRVDLMPETTLMMRQLSLDAVVDVPYHIETAVLYVNGNVQQAITVRRPCDP